MSLSKKWCLLGAPDHQGVYNVGGRIGAALGPLALRGMLLKLKGRDGVLESLDDRGDVKPVSSDCAANHARVIEWAAAAHAETGLSVLVGGGHDHGYSHLRAVRDALGAGRKGRAKPSRLKIGCINIDAHLDVRPVEPVITSGSPFYLALERGVLEPSRLIEFGIQAHCNAREHWDYVNRKKITVIPFERLRRGRAALAFVQALAKLRSRCDAIVISLDLDAVASAFAPGVSAPQAEGFSASEIIEMMEIAGREAKVVSLGVFELNPLHDIDGRTARLGATAVYHFIARRLKPRD